MALTDEDKKRYLDIIMDNPSVDSPTLHGLFGPVKYTLLSEDPNIKRKIAEHKLSSIQEADRQDKLEEINSRANRKKYLAIKNSSYDYLMGILADEDTEQEVKVKIALTFIKGDVKRDEKIGELQAIIDSQNLEPPIEETYDEPRIELLDAESN